MAKLISTIIPTFNRAHYILDALNSVVAQKYRPIEIIIIDDGSTDNTEATISDWKGRNFKSFKDVLELSLKYIKQTNAGPSAARNLGLKSSTGTYIHYMDSDDSIHPELYKEAVFKMINTNSDVCHFGMAFFAGISPTTHFNQYTPPPPTNILDAFFENKLYGYGWGFIRTHKHCQRIGPWDTKLLNIAEDRDYCFRSIISAKCICRITTALYFLRQHNTGRLNSDRDSYEKWSQKLYGHSKILSVMQESSSRFSQKQIGMFRSQMFNLGINMYALGYYDLGKDFGRLGIELKSKKPTLPERRIQYVWHLGPTICRIWHRGRKIKSSYFKRI